MADEDTSVKSRPARHSDSTSPVLPWGTLLLVFISVLVFWWEMRAENVGILGILFDDFSFNWARFIQAPLAEAPRLISYGFFHADLSHLVSNLVFFALFATSVEQRVGTLPFLLLYLAWGACAGLSQGLFSPFSRGLIGASGAIFGTAGAFFVLYPLNTPPRFLGSLLGRWILKIPAFFWIGLWIMDQLHQGFVILAPNPYAQDLTMIGYWAHVGGFAVGALSMAPFIFRRRQK